MSARTHQFTSESVSMGHPDKMADQISDAILDAMLSEDAQSRVACETLVTTGMAVGEVTCDGYVDIPSVVRETVRNIGYDDGAKGFDSESCAVLVSLDQQSPDIAQGVDTGAGLHKEQGAGDQGLMFGFACTETPTFMPLPIDLAHRLMARQVEVRESDKIPHLRPDAKSQVTVEYVDDVPNRINTVVISTQHGPEWNENQAAMKDAVIEHIIRPTLGDWWNGDIIVHVNPTGKFEIGGPQGDAGLTGRKIIVDTYGGRGAHGGGAFSGKDPSKVDRSAAYAARHVAKNLTGAGLADEAEVQIAYAIGVAEPVSIHVDTFGTGVVPDYQLVEIIRAVFDLRPRAIIERLKLLQPHYCATAAYGHFGRSEFTWEALDVVDQLKERARQAVQV